MMLAGTHLTNRGFLPSRAYHLHEMSKLRAPKPKGQESLAQGLRWVNFPLALALKGPSGNGENRPEPLSRIECTFWTVQG
jgi:hypothetical protein